MPRLSVDIDLDYNISANHSSLTKEEIESTIKMYMNANGYELSEKSKFTHILDSFVFSYTNSSGNKDNIKIEINYGLSTHVLNIERKIVSFNSDLIEITMLNKIELYATKITALLNRGAIRDLFDVNSMIENKLIKAENQVLLKKTIIFYSILTNNEDELFDYDNIEKIDYRKVKSDLYPVLRKRGLFDLAFAKEKVINYLCELVTLTDDEKEFINKFYKGDLDLSLLFEDQDIIKRLSEHPMIIWKMNHIREYIGV